MSQNNNENNQEEQGLGKAFTETVIASMGPKTDARLREVMSSFIRHIHDFAREVQLTTDEWMAAIDMINAAGQMSNEKRNESQLLCDIIGLESLVDDVTYSAATNSTAGLTASAILGPFWRNDHPVRENGTSISFDTPADAEKTLLYGRVTDVKTGKPLANATVDIWQASTNGLYEQQDSEQQDLNLRGKFITDEEGRYSIYCIRPSPYPIPEDGPAGQLLKHLDRNRFRPAHIHLLVRSQGYKQLTTQIFDKECKYLGNDCVFADNKRDLCVEFKPREGDLKAKLEVEYNISLAME